VPSQPKLPSELDLQVEWFHQLAVDAIAERIVVDEAMRMSLTLFLETHLPGHSMSSQESDSELIRAIVELRKNETAWNQALQRAIIQADDTFREGESKKAAEVLNRFSYECPWTLFSRVARNQASNYE